MAFHPYPQLIPPVFNLGGFGPPRGLTPASTWPWIDHSASGLQHATERPVQTRFRSGSPSLVNLATHRNSQAHSSKGTPPAACGASSALGLRPLVGTRFQVLLTPHLGSFSPFPHGTGSLSVTREYLALRDGPRGFPPDFTCPVVLGRPDREPTRFRLQDFHPLWFDFPDDSTSVLVCNSPALRPSGSRDTSARKRARV